MKAKKEHSEDLIKVSDVALISDVTAKLKGKVLFPKQVERTREFLVNVKTS